MNASDFPAWLASQQAQVEKRLSQWVPTDMPAGLGEAMRYSVLDGGKRLRPMLVLAAFWFVVLGIGGGGAVQILVGVLCLIGAVLTFRFYGRSRN